MLASPHTDWLELWMNDAPVSWGPFNASHDYAATTVGTGAPASFKILDDLYGDNSGSLTVDVYSCTAPQPPTPSADVCDTPTQATADSLGYTFVQGHGNDHVTLSDHEMYVNLGGNNHVTAGSGDHIICLGNGNDHVTVGDGNNVIDAGGGNNHVTTGNGSNVVTAGNGNDHISTGSGDDTINAGNGNNNVSAGAGDDTITTGSGNDHVNGGSGSNTCTDSGGHNHIVSCTLTP
jgi:Ca2+-binding RTX toxin-like protein